MEYKGVSYFLQFFFVNSKHNYHIQQNSLNQCLQFFFYFYQQKMEQPITEVVNSVSETGQPLQQSYFTLQVGSETFEKSHCYLYDNCIIMKIKKNGKEQILKVKLTYDLILQLTREQTQTKKLGRPRSLKFQKFQSSLILKDSKDEEELINWRDSLCTKINLRGFHQLFKPIKKIGKGNFASVYLVIKHEDDKKYAVKAFSKEGTYSEQFGKQSLINEIQIMRKFSHKNLMKLYQVYESQNSIYISVELLEGGQLYDKIKSKHKFTPKEIKIVMKGILEGLEVMHANNIMHRDLKPQNILLRKEGDFDCVIADFGLAQIASSDYMFVRCGTPGYVAPEVVNLKDLKAKYSPICDLFSVGVIFHLLALRKSPFPGRQYDDVLSQNRACKFNFESSEYQNLPQTWLSLMKRLLQKQPTKRISATQALNHDFFSKDQMFKEFTEYRKSHLMSQECFSPLMTSKNKERKNRGLTRDDSCLKFKMKQNVMTGRTDESGQTIEEIDSPAAIKQKIVKVNESRFKRANHE